MSSSNPRRPSNNIAYLLIALGVMAAGLYSRLRHRKRADAPSPLSGQPRAAERPEQPGQSVEAVNQAATASDSILRADQPVDVSAEGGSSASAAPRLLYALAFVGILLVGFYFRFAGLNWDQYQHQHPDERFLTSVLTAVEIPDTPGEYFDSANSSLNPRNRGYTFFVYGDFPITLGRLVAEGLGDLCAPSPEAPVDATTGRPAPTAFDSIMRSLGFETFCYRADGSQRPMTGYDEVALIGRVLSALFDLGTLVWLFLIAREVYGARAGLAAMGLGALAVLHIQQAHFFTADSFATTFATAAFYFIVRAAKTGSMAHFVAAGIGSGFAVACRINLAPILGILALAAFGRAILKWNDAGRSRSARFERALLEVIVAGVVALATFRIFMPNAFSGLLAPDERWLENMSSISRIVSGEASSPPDVQWTDRKALVFPWVNMVFWGLGLPLGLAAWAGWAAAAWQTLARPYRSRANRTIGEWLRGVFASKHWLIWVWVTAYFVWQGSQWVKAMRYLLPLYPFMAMFAGWLLIAFWDWARSATGATASSKMKSATGVASYARLARFAAYALPVVVSVATFLWAIAFTAIYRQPMTRVAASEWIYENVPTAATLQVVEAGGSRNVRLQLPSETNFNQGMPQVAGFSVSTDGELTGITFPKLSTSGRGLSHVLRVKIALDPGGQEIVAQQDLSVPPGAAAEAVSLAFGGVRLEAGRQYFFVGEAADGALVASSSVLANEHWDDGIPLRIGGRDGFSFYRGIEIQNYNDDTPEKLGLLIDWLDQGDYLFLTSNRLYGSIPRQPLRYPLASEYYRLLFTGELGFDLIAEFASYPALGPFEFPDQETTQALGVWPDPTRLPKPGLISVPYPPAEEAFSVYDHPRVLLFKKSADFSLPDVIARLSRLDLEAAYHGFTPRNETGSPTGQMLTQAAWETQQVSGTWSELFDRDGILNSSSILGTVAWYLLVGALGLAVFPIVYVTVPGLADRGYGLARTVAVLLLSFLIWFPASFRLLPFTREAIALMGVGLALAGGVIARKRRLEIGEWVRRNTRLILVEEIVFLAAFLLFLLLRFGNPDLWHPWKGGEKPMDFAYFNAVIKSQYFPPYDPWFSGGFLTYYYYGWVMLGALTKLLGIVPAIAYNLAVPTVYALAALGTFSVAHGLAARFGGRQQRTIPAADSVTSATRKGNLESTGSIGILTREDARSAKFSESSRPLRLSGEAVSRPARKSHDLPIAVGVLAAVFVMLIGNLGEVKLLYDKVGEIGQIDFNTTLPVVRNTIDFGDGLIRLATGQQELAIPSDWWYWNPTRIIPPGEGEPGPITEFPFFTFLYADLHAHMMALPITILILGLAVSWLTHLPLHDRAGGETNRLTTEAVRSLPVGRSSRSFISMSSASSWFGSHWTGLLSLTLGGLAIGAVRAANTADYPTYLGIGVVALAFGSWAAASLKAKESWLWFVVRAGLLVGTSLVLFAPFAPSDRLGGTSLEGWTGSRTELWAYLFVHGIFLLPIVTYLFLELRRWGLRWTVAVWNTLGEWRWLVGAPAIAAGLLLLYFALTGVSVILVAAPLMAVALVLMLRPRLPVVTRFWLLMVLLALALSLAVELVVIGSDIGRMNMVFKFYYQIWVLLGIAGAVALGWLWRRASIALPRVNGGWRTAVVVMVAAGLLYPPFAARGKLEERFYEGAPPGIDGMAYMRESVYDEKGNVWNLGWDYEALIWMQDNVAGTPVVAEGRSPHEYLWGSRVSIYTGLPTLLGWAHHQRQQRGVAVPHQQIDQRVRDTESLYGGAADATIRKILDRYGVKYIYVGELEKSYYAPEGLAKFDELVRSGMLRVAYQNPGVTLYEVIGNR